MSKTLRTTAVKVSSCTPLTLDTALTFRLDKIANISTQASDMALSDYSTDIKYFLSVSSDLVKSTKGPLTATMDLVWLKDEGRSSFDVV